MAAKIKISTIIHDNQIKILINGFPHLILKKDELIGIQSWMLNDKYRNYAIEFTMKDNVILATYIKRPIWEAILKSLNELDLFSENL